MASSADAGQRLRAAIPGHSSAPPSPALSPAANDGRAGSSACSTVRTTVANSAAPARLRRYRLRSSCARNNDCF